MTATPKTNGTVALPGAAAVVEIANVILDGNAVHKPKKRRSTLPPPKPKRPSKGPLATRLSNYSTDLRKERLARRDRAKSQRRLQSVIDQKIAEAKKEASQQ